MPFEPDLTSLSYRGLFCDRCQHGADQVVRVPLADQDAMRVRVSCHGEEQTVTISGSEIVCLRPGEHIPFLRSKFTILNADSAPSQPSLADLIDEAAQNYRPGLINRYVARRAARWHSPSGQVQEPDVEPDFADEPLLPPAAQLIEAYSARIARHRDLVSGLPVKGIYLADADFDSLYGTLTTLAHQYGVPEPNGFKRRRSPEDGPYLEWRELKLYPVSKKGLIHLPACLDTSTIPFVYTNGVGVDMEVWPPGVDRVRPAPARNSLPDHDRPSPGRQIILQRKKKGE